MKIPIKASAYDRDGDVTRVELYVGETLLRVFKNPPYSLVWCTDVPGEYRVRAIAYDNHELSKESHPVNITLR